MPFDTLRSAVREGLGMIAAKPKIDEDVILYDSLKPAHFKVLMEKYGEEPVLEYIKTMTAKKLKQGE